MAFSHDMDMDGDDIQKCFVRKGQELGPSPDVLWSTQLRGSQKMQWEVK